MQIELSENEMSTLIERVTDKLRKELQTQNITDVIYKDAEKLTNRLIEIHRPEIEAKYVQQYYKLTAKAWDIVLFIFENRSNGVTIYNYTNRVK